MDYLKVDQEVIEKKLKQIQDKWRKTARSKIACKRIMRKKISKTGKSVLDWFPDIGEVMEKIEEEADVGADRWRRTGLYTFSGNPKKRETFNFC